MNLLLLISLLSGAVGVLLVSIAWILTLIDRKDIREEACFEMRMLLHKVLNKLLNPLGLYVCQLYYFEALEEDALSHMRDEMIS